MKLSEMRELLDHRGIRLTRSLGQNFLHDANQLQRIVEAAELDSADNVLEIGPGLGPLTQRLLANSAHVLAIEKDQRLSAVLQERFRDAANLELLGADALDFLKNQPRDWTNWKLVANLPYSVASPILIELAQAHRGPKLMVATLQIEVAKRLMAHEGSREYGLLTLLVQLDYEPLDWFKIPAGCFFPEPDVDSACVTLKRRNTPLLIPEQKRCFSKVAKRAFSERRKMMAKLLKHDWNPEKLAAAMKRIAISPQARAEQVSLKQFADLTRALSEG
jgi:16S rRNA (adenine1518-N6/adenine1519-N6)-dimethyltransferase